MPIDPEPNWKKTIADIKPTNTPIWTKDIADAIDSLVSNKAEVSGIIGSVVFTFNKALFMTSLFAVAATPITPVAAQAIGVAWGTAMMASTILVPPGSSLGVPTPATIWSVCTSLLDVPSVTAAQTSLIAELAAMQAVQVATDSPLGPAIRKAFTSCTVTVSGLNSLAPPLVPTPLIAAAVPLI